MSTKQAQVAVALPQPADTTSRHYLNTRTVMRAREHPAHSFLRAHEHDMRQARAELLIELRKASRPLARTVLRVLRTRVNLNPPAVGEGWPWLVGDLANLPALQVHAIAKAWLALYLYALALDKTCDDREAIPTPLDVLGGALLFEIGVGDFCTITAGSEWQAVARDSFRTAIRHQEADVRLSRDTSDLRVKCESAAGKNSGFRMCTAALAATTAIDGRVLDDFAQSILLAFQHLDDIADFEIDWRCDNYTPLLVRGKSALARLETANAGRLDILAALVRSGALFATLNEIKNGIASGLSRLTDRYGNPRRSAATEFFRNLTLAIDAALRTLEAAGHLLESRTAAPAACFLALRDLEERLRFVAQRIVIRSTCC